MKKSVSKLLLYSAIGIIAVPLSIITHELGHYIAYLFFGAANVQMHSASVSADKEMLSSGQIAIANFLGPAITYATILIAYFITRRRYAAFWIILALAAPIGRIVNAVYIYFRALGYRPNPNFDEFNFAKALDFEPLLVAVPTMMIVIAAFVYFGRKAWVQGGSGEVARLAVALCAGIGVWFTIGPRLLR